MRESVRNYIEGLGLSPEITVLLLAMLPLFELRGSVPIGIIFFELPAMKTAIYSIIGNLIPVIPLLLIFEPVYNQLKRFKWMDRFFEWLFQRTRRKGKLIERMKVVGLILFVGIPLPVTGAWTGSLAAFLFRIPLWQSLPAILGGIIIACVLVSLASLGIIQIPGVASVPSP